MSDFNVRSDSVNVEQVMEQIRSRIREKRGVDYTEQEIRELAAVKLEKFLDPRGVRSDLLTEFRKAQPPPQTVPLYDFEESTLFDSHRGFVRFIRRLLRPVLKLAFNANAIAQSLHLQSQINRQNVEGFDRVRHTGELYYELLHNLVLELTRATIEVKNMKMRVESLASRLEFTERRQRALESVVVYKPSDDEVRPSRPQHEPRPAPEPVRPAPASFSPAPQPTPVPQTVAQPGGATGTPEGPGQRSRRRRRRRGRRGGAPAATVMGGAAPQDTNGGHDAGELEEMTADQPEDARDTRPEPFEHAFGSSSHPAEPREDHPAEAAPAAPAPTSSAPAADPVRPPAPDGHDPDNQ